ncbi:hypothetical protein V2I08_20345 [Sphingobium sp. MK2]
MQGRGWNGCNLGLKASDLGLGGVQGQGQAGRRVNGFDLNVLIVIVEALDIDPQPAIRQI